MLADPARIDRYTNISGFGLTWCSLLPFFSVSLILLLEVLGFWLTPLGLMRNSERLGFPIFAFLDKGIPALRNSMKKSRVATFVA